MRRVAAMLGTAAAVVLLATRVFAQTPNFAGKWAPDAEKNAAAMAAMGGGGGGRAGGGGGGRMGGMGGGDMTITQDAKQLVITRTTPNGEQKTTYNLDGTESKNMMMGRGGQTEQVSKAAFEGGKLVIKTQTPNGETVAFWYMEGDHLVNERTGGQGNAVKTYYKKAS